MKRVEVEWVDSNANQGWRSLDTALRESESEDLVCLSCGYLVAETDRYLLLALSRADASADVKAAVADTIQIPHVAVLKVRQLR